MPAGGQDQAGGEIRRGELPILPASLPRADEKSRASCSTVE
ncbi:MAG: hypothetical protein ACRYG8_48945 [Janthinobacterium lividum]